MELGEWVKARRTEFNSGKLNSLRIQELEALPGWTWDPFEDKWQLMYHRLLSEVENNRGSLPNTFNDKNISTWVTRQRNLKSKNNLPEDRIILLELVNGWHWEYQTIIHTNWDEMFDLLCKYVEIEGDARVRDKSTWQGAKLGTWVSVFPYFVVVHFIIMPLSPKHFCSYVV